MHFDCCSEVMIKCIKRLLVLNETLKLLTLKVILLSVKVLREQGAAWVYLLSEDNYQEVMSSTSDPSSTSQDTFRQRLRPAESSEESIEPLSVCDDIYCDISEEISSRPDSSSSWTGFWRRWGRGEARRETKLKKGEGRGSESCIVVTPDYTYRPNLRETEVYPLS